MQLPQNIGNDNRAVTRTALLPAMLFWVLAAFAEAEGGNGIPVPPSPDKPVVVWVNGDPVTEAQIERRLQAVHGDLTSFRKNAARWQRMRDAALEIEIRDRLLLQAARAEHMEVSAAEVAAARARSLELLGEDRFRDMLAARGIPDEGYDAFLRDRLLIERYRNRLFKDIAVNEETLHAYYTGHQELFTVPRRLHLESVRVESSGTAREVIAALRSGKNFQELADSLSAGSDDPPPIRNIWITVEKLPGKIRQAAEIAAPGDVLEAVEERGGIRIVRVLELQPPHTQGYDEVRESLRNRLLRRRQEAVLDQWYERARREATIRY